MKIENDKVYNFNQNLTCPCGGELEWFKSPYKSMFLDELFVQCKICRREWTAGITSIHIMNCVTASVQRGI